MFKLHFISGLPRSGSTLLSAILKQNPHFLAGMTSPVGSLCSALLPKMSSTSEFSPFFSDDRRYHILRSLFAAYYRDAQEDAIVFDTNRNWTARLALLDQLFPDARVICCVREVGWVLDSLERALKRNPAQVSRLVDEGGKTVYGRVDKFMNPENGLVGFAWSALREAWFSEFATKLIVVPYEQLASDPNRVIKKLYEALDLPLFPHRFDNVEHTEDVYDELFLGTPGLHTVRPRVALEKRTPVIPPDILKKYADVNFWTKSELNTKNVLMIKAE